MTPVATIGERNRKVVLRAPNLTGDEGGGFSTGAPTDLATVWAQIQPLEGDEQLQAMQTGMQRPHRLTIEYRAGVTGITEIGYGARKFNVRSVTDPDEKHRELVILADEVIVS